jgi:hypothetical protein
MSNLNHLLVATITASLCLLPATGLAQQGWGTPDSLGPARGGPAAAIDHLGNIVAVWTVNADGGAFLQARRYARAAAAWSAPVDISGPSAFDSTGAKVIMDAAGNATVAWLAGGVRLARYVVATDTWSAPVEIADQGPCSSEALRGVTDLAGGVFLTWRSACRFFPSSAFGSHIHAARYDPATGTVVGATLTPALIPGFVTPDLVADATGNATVVWPERGVEVVIKAAQYSAAAGTWGGATTLVASPGGATAEGLRAGIDGRGNVIVLWYVATEGVTPPGAYNAVRATRYDQATRQWSPVSELTTSAELLTQTVLAVDTAGNALAAWTRRENAIPRVQAALYDVGTGSWSPVVDLSAPDVPTHTPRAVVDGFGSLTLVWQQLDLIHAARRSAGGVISTTTLTRDDDPIVAVAAGVAGHVAVLWRGGATIDTRSMNVVEWRATPTPPRIDVITPGDGRLTVRVTPPVSDEPAFAARSYDYSVDDGATWTRDGSGLLVSPVRITGLTNGVAYPVRVRALNHAGAGAPSPAVPAVPQPAPAAPTALTVVAQSGRVVTLQWTPGLGAMPAAGYVVEGGELPGQVQATLPVTSGLPTLTFEAPPGAYYLRVHAVAGAAWSASSNEIPHLRGAGHSPVAAGGRAERGERFHRRPVVAQHLHRRRAVGRDAAGERCAVHVDSTTDGGVVPCLRGAARPLHRHHHRGERRGRKHRASRDPRGGAGDLR